MPLTLAITPMARTCLFLQQAISDTHAEWLLVNKRTAKQQKSPKHLGLFLFIQICVPAFAEANRKLANPVRAEPSTSR